MEYGENYLIKEIGKMKSLNFMKQYVFEDESDDIWNNKHVFFKVDESEIMDLEDKLQKRLPIELKNFYKEIGYGFINCGKGTNTNRIISPIEIYDFYAGINDYENDIRREYYKDSNMIIFFEVSADTFITIDINEINDQGESPIYYFNKKISNSLYDFIKSMDVENNFYIKNKS